jgi:hypothetical protein
VGLLGTNPHGTECQRRCEFKVNGNSNPSLIHQTQPLAMQLSWRAKGLRLVLLQIKGRDRGPAGHCPSAVNEPLNKLQSCRPHCDMPPTRLVTILQVHVARIAPVDGPIAFAVISSSDSKGSRCCQTAHLCRGFHSCEMKVASFSALKKRGLSN